MIINKVRLCNEEKKGGLLKVVSFTLRSLYSQGNRLQCTLNKSEDRLESLYAVEGRKIYVPPEIKTRV
jgi:hypothetical protein